MTGETSLRAEALLERLHTIERTAGRRRAGPRDGPRELDLDLLLYGERVETSSRPLLPHPRMHERAFVLVPLAEIAGGWLHPVLGRTVAELAERVGGQGVEATNLRLDPRGSGEAPGRTGTGEVTGGGE